MYNDSFRLRYGNAPIAISSTDDFSPTEPHIHNEIEMLYIVKGESEVQISNQTFRAKGGDLLFVNPLEVHGITVFDTQPYCHLCICFDPSLIADGKVADNLQKGHLAIPHFFTGEDTLTQKLSGFFREMYDAVNRDSKALLFDVTAIISMMFSAFVKCDLLSDHTVGGKESLFCLAVMHYISQHYSEEITSKEIAASLFYTQNHFCRKFKTIYGVAFSEYLNMYRLLKAKEMLSAYSGKVSDVAQACGFNDASYFTKCFKESFGVTPMKYQKNQSHTKI